MICCNQFYTLYMRFAPFIIQMNKTRSCYLCSERVTSENFEEHVVDSTVWYFLSRKVFWVLLNYSEW